jgi:hypothetical protein
MSFHPFALWREFERLNLEIPKKNYRPKQQYPQSCNYAFQQRPIIAVSKDPERLTAFLNPILSHQFHVNPVSYNHFIVSCIKWHEKCFLGVS